MATTTRDRIEIIHNGDVAGTTEDVQTVLIADGETWQLNRITFADLARPNNLWSGVFRVEYGTDTIAVAYLMGTTHVQEIKRNFTGDGVKELRIIRENLGNQAKAMFVMVEGFKRIQP
jgi:hypothetical protein